jgi:hypothetical protein
MKVLIRYPHQATIIGHLNFKLPAQLTIVLHTQNVQIELHHHLPLLLKVVQLDDVQEIPPLHFLLNVSILQANLLLLDLQWHFHLHYTPFLGSQFTDYALTSTCT